MATLSGGAPRGASADARRRGRQRLGIDRQGVWIGCSPQPAGDLQEALLGVGGALARGRACTEHASRGELSCPGLEPEEGGGHEVARQTLVPSHGVREVPGVDDKVPHTQVQECPCRRGPDRVSHSALQRARIGEGGKLLGTGRQPVAAFSVSRVAEVMAP